MSKSFKATWLGDDDANAQIIRMGDLRFIKGEEVTVPANHPYAEYIDGNPTFAIDKKGEPVEAVEPDEDELEAAGEAGTEKGTLKAAIRAAGGTVPKGNPSVDTLRGVLAKATD